MVECPICHVLNKDGAPFCIECGQRIAIVSEPQSMPGLDRALLTSPQPNPVPQRPALGGQQAPKLHSPLLGGSELEDDFLIRAKKNKDESYFPHRHSDFLANPYPEPDANAAPVKQNKGLRSPLLGGGDEEDTEVAGESTFIHKESPASFKQQRPAGRLHSPVLDGPIETSEQFTYEEAFIVEEINDPNILRSPLLSAKAKISPVPQPGSFAPPKVLVNSPAQAPADSTAVLGNKTSSKIDPSFNKAEPFRQPPKPAAKPVFLSKSVNEIDMHKSDDRYHFSQSLVITLVFLTVGAKVYYLCTLGATALTSFAFLLDQFVQVTVIVALIIFLARTINKD